MGFAISAGVNLADLLADLEGLKKALRNRILKRAIGAGTKLILREAKARAPRETGLLRKSLGRKVKVYRNSGTVVGIVGPRAGFKETVTRSRGRWLPGPVVSDPIRYAHLVELGTRPHALGKGSNLRKGRQSGHTHPGAAARPFLRPAVQALGTQVRAAIAREVAAGLAKAGGG